MNYALGSSFNLDDMIMNFPYKKLKFNCKDSEKIVNDRHRNKVVKKIFKECLKEILLDVINNNVTFQLPTGSRPADIHLERIEGEKFKIARKNGKFKDVDFLKSFFSGYQLYLYMYGKHARKKPIYVDKKLKKLITDNTNNGIIK